MPDRIRKALKSYQLPSGNLYARGFPRNSANDSKFEKIKLGDICFFYGFHKTGNKYLWAARVNRLIPKDKAEDISLAFWDNCNFLPYMLDGPIEIFLTTEELGRSLNPDSLWQSAG